MRPIVLRHFRLLTILVLSTGFARAQEQNPPPGPTDGPAPRVELSETEWDFGTVWQNAPVERNVLVRNVGDAPLKIVSVRTSCGCTAAKPEKDEIAPGESVAIRVKYDSARSKTHVSTTVTITTNDPKQPTSLFHVKGEVKPFYSLDPATGVSFGQVQRDVEATRSLEIRNTFSDKLSLKLKAPKSGHFAFELKEIEPGMHYQLTARTIPPLDLGNSNGEAVLATGLPDMPQIVIPVRAYVMPRVNVSPMTLYVPKVYTKPSVKPIRVSTIAGTPAKVLEVACDNPDVKAEIQPQGTTNAAGISSQLVTVSLPPGDQIPDEGLKLVIRTDAPEPEYRELTVMIVNGLRRTNVVQNQPRPVKPTPTPPSNAPVSGSAHADEEGAGAHEH